MIYENIKFAFLSIKKYKFRTFISCFCIAVGVACVLFVITLSDTGKNAVNRELDSMGVNGVTLMADRGKLTGSVLNYIKQQSSVLSAVPVVVDYSTAVTKNLKCGVLLFGIDAQSQGIISLEIIKGREFFKSEINDNEKVCIIDRRFAENTFGKLSPIGKQIYINIGGSNKCFTVCGVADAKSCLIKYASSEYLPNMIYLPYTTLQKYKGTKKLSQIIVKFTDGKNIDKKAEKIISAVSNNVLQNKDELMYENLSSQRDKLNGIMDLLSLLLTSIAAVSLLVAFAGSTSVQIMSVNERTREIGIKKAIGEKRHSIIGDYLCESVVVYVIGAAFGILIFMTIIYIANKTLDIKIVTDFKRMISVITINIAVGSVFGMIPAVKASLLNPVDALNR